MKLTNLENMFNAAIKENVKYVGVKIETRGSEGAEIIVNPTCNFANKLDYYKKAYTEDLVLKSYDGIKITGFTYANTLRGIETDLIGSDDDYSNFNMSFSMALDLLKQGVKVAREGWNGKGMYLAYVKESQYKVDGEVHYDSLYLAPWVGMKTADGKFVPWLASQTDMLSEDWVIVE